VAARIRSIDQAFAWICFAGACTVGKVAARLNRDYIMIDLKKEYCEMGEKRVAEGETGIPVKEQKQGQRGLFE